MIEENGLTNLQGLNNLDTVAAWAGIQDNDKLTTLLGLENLSFIGTSFSIEKNDALVNLSGLDNLKYIGGDLRVHKNSSLLDISNLISVTAIGGRLTVSMNPMLNSLYGLDNIAAESLNGLSIFSNLSLSECNVQSVCEYLPLPGGDIDIYDNAQGCNSVVEVYEGCDFGTEENENYKYFSIHPNPFTLSTNIVYEVLEPSRVIMTVHSQQGRQILKVIDQFQPPGNYLYKWNTRDLAAGLYYYGFWIGRDMATGKIVILR